MVSITVLALLLVAAALLGGRRRQPSLPADRPEATVQTYLATLASGDRPAALDTLTESLRTRCATSFEALTGLPEIDRAELIRVTANGDGASVEVRLTVGWSGALFDSGGSAFPVQFSLLRSGAGWQIDQAPWPMGSCSPPSSGP